MKTIIQGKILDTTYSVDKKQKEIKDENGNNKVIFTGKPKIVKETKLNRWKNIKELDGEIKYNSYIGTNCLEDRINLSEDEEVTIKKKITRVDLEAYVLHTDKVLSELEVSKEESEELLEKVLKEFNKEMIESNDALLAYCHLHKLDPSETDLDELFKIVYPDRTYFINPENGDLCILRKIERSTMFLSSDLCADTDSVFHSISPYVYANI